LNNTDYIIEYAINYKTHENDMKNVHKDGYKYITDRTIRYISNYKD